jgi:small conductance mechanosensitive channel
VLKQWEVAGEFRKRLKIAFDNEGIEIPFPQRVIHYAKPNETEIPVEKGNTVKTRKKSSN